MRLCHRLLVNPCGSFSAGRERFALADLRTSTQSTRTKFTLDARWGG